MKEKYDATRSKPKLPPFQVGDIVKLEETNLKAGFGCKLSDRFTGPYQIWKVLSDNTAWLAQDDTLFPVPVHMDRLSHFNLRDDIGTIHATTNPGLQDNHHKY